MDAMLGMERWREVGRRQPFSCFPEFQKRLAIGVHPLSLGVHLSESG